MHQKSTARPSHSPLKRLTLNQLEETAELRLVARKETLTLLKNALANVFRGGAAAVVAVVLPSFLARLMSTSAYGAWLLILQLSAYVGYLDFGIQTAVGRFVAHSNERGDAGPSSYFLPESPSFSLRKAF